MARNAMHGRGVWHEARAGSGSRCKEQGHETRGRSSARHEKQGLHGEKILEIKASETKACMRRRHQRRRPWR
jgi:hypothetical protein